MSDISVKYTDCPYVVSKFNEHNNIKDTLLKSIADMQGQILVDKHQSVYSDWHISREIPRHYWKTIFPSLTEHMIRVYDKLGFNEFSYLNSWFQQYSTNDFHNWHVHGEASWTNIYYLEFPNTELSTNIKNQKTSSILVPEIQEGDILTMPAMLWHKSPTNSTNSRKTVIVFNTTTPY